LAFVPLEETTGVMAVGDATKVVIVIKAITIKINYPVGL